MSLVHHHLDKVEIVLQRTDVIEMIVHHLDVVTETIVPHPDAVIETIVLHLDVVTEMIAHQHVKVEEAIPMIVITMLDLVNVLVHLKEDLVVHLKKKLD